MIIERRLSGMIKWIRRCREKKSAQKQKRERDAEGIRRWREAQLEKCRKDEHVWEYIYEIQGDGDPNIEGYILITRATCSVCGESETTIEPYDKEDA